MLAARDSVLRRIAGVSAGMILGAGAAVTALVFVADATSRGEGGSAAWVLGVGLIRYGYGVALLVGGLAGAWLGRRHLAKPRRSPWSRRPAGTILNHYPVAMLGGVIIGSASSVFTIPAARAVTETLSLYADMIMPRVVHTTWLLMVSAVLLGVLSVARWTVHALDRDIYVRRRLRARSLS